MTTIQKTKNKLINRILGAKNEKLLNALDTIFVNAEPNQILSFTSEQIEMLLISELDIASGNLVPAEEFHNLDS